MKAQTRFFKRQIQHRIRPCMWNIIVTSRLHFWWWKERPYNTRIIL